MALAFGPEVNSRPEPSSVHLSAAPAVITTAMAAESPPPTPPSVAEAFVRVLVGFGGGRAAIWRLLAMVKVVEVSKFGWKMARKERKQQKKSFSAPMVFRTTAGESTTLGLISRSDDHETGLFFGFPEPFSL